MRCVEATMRVLLLFDLDLDRLPTADNVKPLFLGRIMPVFVSLRGSSSDDVVLDTGA